jgi:hypothetical protein
MPPAGGNFSATLPKGLCEHLDKIGFDKFDKLVRPDFYVDFWQDCRKSTEPLTGFGNVAEPDFFCPVGGLTILLILASQKQKPL